MTLDAEFQYCPACGAPLRRREAFGKLRPVCKECGRVHFRDPKVAAAVLAERDGRVLLVRRVMEPERGKWSLPAGFVDPFEDPQLAAARECLEETGLKVRQSRLMDVVYGREHTRGASIVIVYRARLEDGQPQASDDADAVGFFASDGLPPLAFDATRKILDRWKDHQHS